MHRERRRLYYSGRVQGVGFRYTANRIAQNFDLSGTIRSLPDGRVELLVEGNASDLNVFLEAIAEAMKRYIEDVAVERLPAGEPPLGPFSVVC